MSNVRARATLVKRQLLEEDAFTTGSRQFGERYLDDPVGFVKDCIEFKGNEKPDIYQMEILESIVDHKRVCVRAPHGAGKDLDILTPIPTPDGWSTMGELKAGDIIFDENGQQTTVLYAEEPQLRDAYEVCFSDKTSIIAGAGHLWKAVDVYNRPKEYSPVERHMSVSDWRDFWEYTKTIDTKTMLDKIKTKGGQLRWRIPTCKPLNLPDIDLPIDPYVLGVWLGDGHKHSGRISSSPDDINELNERIRSLGWETKILDKNRTISVYGLLVKLRKLNVLGDKHIPMIYLRASEKQRRELLAGIMDTDGFRTRNSDGIDLCSGRLALGLAELVRTLGIPVRYTISDAAIYGRITGKRWRFNIRFDECPFRFKRKRKGWEKRGAQASRHTQRTVMSINYIGKKMTRCIAVDSPSHLFLAGEAMIPTHNTTLMSWAILWFALTRDAMEEDWKIPTTASAWRQLTKFLWPEVHKWSYRLKWDVINRKPFNSDELLAYSIRLKYGEAYAAASSTPELIEGAHADHIFYIFDESKKIANGIWDSAEGAFSTGDAIWLACSTPGEQKGRFYQIHSRAPGFEDWHPYHITLDDFLATGRVNEKWVEDRRKQWGETSVIFQNRVLGNFAADETMGVVPLSWVEDAVTRWHDWQDSGGHGIVTSIGVDTAGGASGGDKNTIAVCYDGNKIGEIIHFMPKNPDQSTMELANFIAPLLDKYPTATLVVDSIGVGAGVVHRIREMGYRAISFVSNAKVDVRDQTGILEFYNWRSAAWWLMREMLDPRNKFEVCLPPDDAQTYLTSDLTVPHYMRRQNGKLWIENKETLRRVDRLGRSPDDADAVIYAMCGPTLSELTFTEEVISVSNIPGGFGDW